MRDVRALGGGIPMVAAGAVRNLRRTSMFSTLFTRKPESTKTGSFTRRAR